MIEQDIIQCADTAGLFSNTVRKGFTNDYVKGLEKFAELIIERQRSNGEAVMSVRVLDKVNGKNVYTSVMKPFDNLPVGEYELYAAPSAPIEAQLSEPINEVAAFEKWLSENTLCRANLNIELEYADPLVEMAYKGWKARKALILSTQAPKEVE